MPPANAFVRLPANIDEMPRRYMKYPPSKPANMLLIVCHVMFTSLPPGVATKTVTIKPIMKGPMLPIKSKGAAGESEDGDMPLKALTML